MGELFLPVPWLIASLFAYQTGWYPLGAIASFFFFLSGLRVVHGAQHYTLGVPRAMQDGVLAALSGFMLASMHAIQATHWQHHRCCLDNTDVEARPAGMSWWRALTTGPVFICSLHREGYRLARPRAKRWILGELGIVAGLIGLAVLNGPLALQVHVLAMLAGECATGFFAVWTVHHDCPDAGVTARTQRGSWKPRLAYHMFYHREHHWFPAVPTPHLPELARRVDAVMPFQKDGQVY